MRKFDKIRLAAAISGIVVVVVIVVKMNEHIFI